MQHRPIRLGLALGLTVAIATSVPSAEPPTDGRSVTVERNGRTVTISEDGSGITVKTVDGDTTTIVEADDARELRAKSRSAHWLYQRYLRRGRSRAEANADGKAVAGGGDVVANPPPSPLPGPGQVVGPGQIAVGNGLTAGNLLEATKAMASGNRSAWNRGFGATSGWATGGTGTSVSFRDGNRRVMVSENSTTGITVAITENGATNAVTARTAEELARKSPEALRLYQEAGKRARVTAGGGVRASGGANGSGDPNASSSGSSNSSAKAGGLAGGNARGNTGGTATGGGTAIPRRAVLERMLRNARTEQERAAIRKILRQLGQ